MIDQRAAMKIQPELMSGENLQWAGMPNSRVIFHSEDWLMIPFSLLWGGFSVFWEFSAVGGWRNIQHGHTLDLMALWGVPFVLIGQYMIWGRFVYDAWLKTRTHYGVTDRRVIVLQEGFNRQTSASYLESVPTIAREGKAIGTLWFGEKLPVFGGRGQKTRGSRFAVGAVPVFADVENVDDVYRLVTKLREEKSKSDSSSTFSFR